MNGTTAEVFIKREAVNQLDEEAIIKHVIREWIKGATMQEITDIFDVRKYDPEIPETVKDMDAGRISDMQYRRQVRYVAKARKR